MYLEYSLYKEFCIGETLGKMGKTVLNCTSSKLLLKKEKYML